MSNRKYVISFEELDKNSGYTSYKKRITQFYATTPGGAQIKYNRAKREHWEDSNHTESLFNDGSVYEVWIEQVAGKSGWASRDICSVVVAGSQVLGATMDLCEAYMDPGKDGNFGRRATLDSHFEALSKYTGISPDELFAMSLRR